MDQGYAAAPAGHALRLEVEALPDGKSGNIEISYKLRPSGATDPAAAVGAPAAASAAAVDWDYPAGAFDILEALREELTAGWDRTSPTDWKDIPQGVGITVPFSKGVPAVRMRVKREFTSKAKPFWVQFQDASGESRPKRCPVLLGQLSTPLRDQSNLNVRREHHRHGDENGR